MPCCPDCPVSPCCPDWPVCPTCPCGPAGPGTGAEFVLHPAIRSTSESAPTSSDVFILILLCGIARRRTLPLQRIVRSEDSIHSHWRALFECAQLLRKRGRCKES